MAKENALHVFYLDYKLVIQVFKSNIGSRLTIKLKIRTDSKLLSGFATKKMCDNLQITQAPKINLKKVNKKLNIIKCMNVIQHSFGWS